MSAFAEPVVHPITNAPSTAFCLLYTVGPACLVIFIHEKTDRWPQLYCMRLTERQMLRMLNHPSSVYTRALGFLYLRFCAPPADLLDWFYDYLNDPQPVKVRMAAAAPPVPLGKYLRDLLCDLSYLSTRLPRIPVLQEKVIRDELDKMPFGAAPPAAAAAAAEPPGVICMHALARPSALLTRASAPQRRATARQGASG
jgi:pre-mRNA-splicing factor 38B